MLEDGLGGLFLSAGRVPVTAEDVLDHVAQLGARRLAVSLLSGPVAALKHLYLGSVRQVPDHPTAVRTGGGPEMELGYHQLTAGEVILLALDLWTTPFGVVLCRRLDACG